jgi:hypothetical protein
MLSNSERRTLAEIEERLQSQDQAFIQMFERDVPRFTVKNKCGRVWHAWLFATALMWCMAIVITSPAMAALAVSVMSVGLIFGEPTVAIPRTLGIQVSGDAIGRNGVC